MTSTQLEDRAAAMYHKAAQGHPTWDQLGDGTKALWRASAALAEVKPAAKRAAPPPKAAPVSRFAKYLK